MHNPEKRHLRPYKGLYPTLGEGAYVDESAVVIGDVELGPDVSVWPLCVIRGDVNRVRIGARTNIQDATVIHESRPRPDSPDGYATTIGEDVTIAHKVMLHGCEIGNEVLIGMGTIVLDGAVIEDRVIVGAGALVTPGKRLESGFLYTGAPARQKRPLTASELAHFKIQAGEYRDLKNDYLSG